MFKDLLAFLSLSDPNVRLVILGILLFASSCAVVGCFTFLRKKSLVGEAIAHSVLPGICLAFILFQSKSLFILVLGAAFTGWLSLLSIEYIGNKTRLKPDAVIALVLSVFFGLGILMLTSIQNSGNAAQSGLNHFLFGQAASINRADIISFAVVAIIVLITVILFFNPFKLLSFDEDFAKSVGVPVKLMKFLLSSLTVLTVAVSIQAVGVVLVAAMLITPAAGARFWTNDLVKMMFIAAFFAILAGIAGAFISYELPSMPTGPWIVTIVSIIAILSMIFSPERGFLSRLLKRRGHDQKVLIENVLKIFYHLGEAQQDFAKSYSMQQLQKRRDFKTGRLTEALRKLKGHQMIEEQANKMYKLTPEGEFEAKRIARLHRLWELYLTRYLRLREDHVHDDAESMEHIITPEIEALLEKELERPKVDPHGKQIYYSN